MYLRILFLLLLCCLSTSLAKPKRCYVCRSRGPLGDCKDMFLTNSSSHPESVKRVPCPSGWCGKSVEGKQDDHLLATQRLCLLTGPSDNVERCSDTIFASKKVFMCFCRGDLCNQSVTNELSISSFVFTLLITLFSFILMNN